MLLLIVLQKQQTCVNFEKLIPISNDSTAIKIQLTARLNGFEYKAFFQENHHYH